MYTTNTHRRYRSSKARHVGLADTHLARIVAVFASTGAGIVHVVVTDDHWSEWPPAGLFFAAISVAQLAWAMAAAVSPARALLVLGILGNAGSILLWGISRTAGIPFGPHAGVPEAVSTADVLTTALEVIVCGGAAWSLRRPRRWIRSLPAAMAAVAGVGLVSVAVTVPAVRDAAAGHSHGPGTGHSDGHQHGPGQEHPTPPDPTAPGPRSSEPEPNPSPSRTHDHGDGHDHQH